jgi:hypothetical protein
VHSCVINVIRIVTSQQCICLDLAPRHERWTAALTYLRDHAHTITGVAADPPLGESPDDNGGWN